MMMMIMTDLIKEKLKGAREFLEDEDVGRI